MGAVPMIFPGMDPYLEHPQFWAGVHSRLIVYCCDQLQPQLLPRYVASIEERVYVEGHDRHVVPDLRIERTAAPSRQIAASGAAVLDEPIVVEVPLVEIHERYIAILDRQTDLSVVTIVEVVSPTNKDSGPGRDSYLQKQREVRSSSVHLVEIDLLRQGKHVVAVPEWRARQEGLYDYPISVNRAREIRDQFELYLRKLQDPLPSVRIPLAGEDPDVRLDLQAALSRTWEAGGYRHRIRYAAPCLPSLSGEDQAWADECIRAAVVAD